ncbi:MAG: amino acid adenylation domain-containing protein [Firmicutes bacterium]|nr:amino acid adenylation domain-containing protein [Bacillota bacterium]
MMQTNIFDYLEKTAARLPEKTAFVDETESCTFGLLYERALRMGTFLAGQITPPAVPPYCRPVAVVTDRSLWSVTGFLAVLASGNFYVPIDKDMPRIRMEKVLQKLQPAFVIGGEKAVEDLGEVLQNYPVRSFPQIVENDIDEDLLNARRRQVLDVDPCYVFFTSGSTGEPKGIAVSHGNLIDFTEWYTDEFESAETDICANQPPFYFDASGRDLFPCLKTGGTVHILPKKLFMFPMLLINYLNEHQVNVLNWATSAFHLVAASRVLEKFQPHTVKRILLGGEALQAKQVRLWKAAVPGVEIVNVYGPTETTVDCCFYRVEKDFADGEAIPIGKACANMQLFVLGEKGEPVEKGEPGELCVRGRGVSNGYYGDFEKSDAAFVQSPLNPLWHDRIYRTGDIVKEGEDGNLYFLSRQDNQIKHMGYRIELGETENALAAIEGIDQAVCLFDKEKDKILCVFSGEATDKQIAKAVADYVPKYMCPNIYVKKDRLPMNANGKIDRAALRKELLSDGEHN